MKVALIQTDLTWEDPQANRKHFEGKIDSIQEPADLILLPEMFTTGFTMNPKPFAETMKGETVLWLKHWAKHKDLAIAGSIIITENGNFYNRLLFVFPSGEIQYYDKRHLFSLAGEEKAYVSGKEKLIIAYRGWKICPLVCYDLRFPVFSRNTEEYDLLLYVANWPKARIQAWDILLKARAIENMCYAIGLNRIGNDGNGHPYNGHSQAVDFLGNPIAIPSGNDEIIITNLNREEMLEMRKKLGFLNDKDVFEIKN